MIIDGMNKCEEEMIKFKSSQDIFKKSSFIKGQRNL
jgi:hypothetical protein